jgi:putative FmdB family regulatory protein
MPLYEYECEACGHRFETIQKFSDPPLERCPKCGGVVRKLQSAPAFHLKGSGWYITDYARKDSGAAGAESKSDTKAGETATDTKTESKSESKRESKRESKGESKSESKGESKGESKSESKGESKPRSAPPASDTKRK